MNNLLEFVNRKTAQTIAPWFGGCKCRLLRTTLNVSLSDLLADRLLLLCWYIKCAWCSHCSKLAIGMQSKKDANVCHEQTASCYWCWLHISRAFPPHNANTSWLHASKCGLPSLKKCAWMKKIRKKHAAAPVSAHATRRCCIFRKMREMRLKRRIHPDTTRHCFNNQSVATSRADASHARQVSDQSDES